jgi:hypothetical protein
LRVCGAGDDNGDGERRERDRCCSAKTLNVRVLTAPEKDMRAEKGSAQHRLSCSLLLS